MPIRITAQKLKFSTKDFFSECDIIRRKLRILSHLLNKSLIEKFIFCAVDKLHLPLSYKEKIIMKIGETEIKSSNCVNLLGIKFDDKIIFNEHIHYITDNASRRINTFPSLAPYMNESKKHIIINSFFLVTVLLSSTCVDILRPYSEQ